ncbi:MAG: hypothetical protein IJJ72_05175 [Bacteroidales bacterium]|nr:hypothetical protein [Bacteroidales bacterium]
MKRLLYLSSLLLAAGMLLLPLPAQAQNKKKLNLKLPTTKLATVKFNADDPYAKENQKTDGTPWEQVSAEPVKLPDGVKAVIPDPLPDVSKISTIEYNMAVSVAFESLRIIYGEMSEKDAERFMQMWAPLFNNPSQEIIDYMNKLNPLLSQFIVARESYLNSVSNVELLLLDASEAVGWDDQEAFSSAMFQAKLYTGTIKQLEAAMDELANRIQALGNPPNPFEARQAARDRYRRAFKPKEIYLGETWMGTRIDKEHQVEGLDPLTEPMMRYLMKVKVNGEDRYFVLELKEDGIAATSDSDPQGVGNVKIEQMYFSDKGNLMPDFKSDGTFQTYYPRPPAMALTMMTMTLMRQFETSYVSDEDRKKPDYAARKQQYHDLAGHYGNRVLRAGVFFKTALLWAMEDKFNTYEWKDDGVVPFKLLDDLEEAFKKQAVIEAENAKNLPKLRLGGNRKKKADDADDAGVDSQAAQAAFDQASARKQQVQDSLAFEEKSKQESIAWREENIKLIENNIRRDEEGRSNAMRRLSAAKTAQERQWIQQEIDDYNRRIMYQRSDIQSERDNIRQLQTGQFVHTRTEFEQYAHEKMVHDSKVEAERYIQTKKAAAIIDRQINLLPEEDRDAARERAEKMFYEDGALASGDIEKARKLANIFNNQINAAAMKDQAEAQEEVAWADLKEAGANAVIMACGSITVGLAGEALAGAYGAGTAATIWGSRAVGAVYGGVTGYIAGGPGKAASSAAGYFHPVTGGIASFIEGYTAEGMEGKSTYERIWNGAKQAGQDYLVGKAFELGATGIAKTASAFLPDGIVNFNLTKGLSKSGRQKLDVLRTQRERLEAEDAVKSFSKLNNEYIGMLADGKTPKARLDEARQQINQLAASLNSDYHAKWYMKYKAEPNLRAHFDQAVQANYRQMTPKMTESLAKQGYNMNDIEFKQFRNSSSSGSSSMDLDLAPVSKSTGKEPKFYKNGEEVTAREFMNDAQKTMNTVYKQQHEGLSAKASEMNLTTSAHPEAYSTPELLKKDVDYSKLKAEDIASIGKVLESKVNTIEGNIRMTETTKMQAKCRESTKEIDNMLVPKLKQELKNATNAKQAEQIAGDIEYWQDMSKKLGRIGKETSDPMEIHRLNREIQRDTGGKDAMQVVNDLIREFNPNFKPSAN